MYIYYKTEFIFHLASEVNSNVLLTTIKKDRKIKQLKDKVKKKNRLLKTAHSYR